MKLNDMFDWTGNSSFNGDDASLASTDNSWSKDLTTASSAARTEASAPVDDRLCDDTVSILTLCSNEREQIKALSTEERDNAELAAFAGDTYCRQESQREALRSQQAEDVRSVFADPSMWRYLDNFQIECLGVECTDPGLPIMSVRRVESWSWFERQNDVKENDVVMTVEVSL